MTEYQAQYFDVNNEFTDCSGNMTRREAVEHARAWLSTQPVGCRAMIVQLKEVCEIATERAYGVKHLK